jgi:hypothetical protein
MISQLVALLMFLVLRYLKKLFGDQCNTSRFKRTEEAVDKKRFFQKDYTFTYSFMAFVNPF